MITVFTPSYNRKDELKKLYKSLLNQDTDNFEWLIVDDGSVDNTKDYINKLIKDKKINIKYIYKENGGKQSAYNVGLDNAKGDVFLCIDSDDILRDNVLKLIDNNFKNIKNKKDLAGVMYIQGYINNKDKVIGTEFPKDNMIDSYYNIYNNYNVKGDKLIILKTNVAREYYFPIIEGEKFVPEALIFNRISLKYNFLCKNEIVAYKEYLDSGYSNNYFSLVKKNPLGNSLYYREVYNFNNSLYNVYGYILFSIYGKKKFKDIIGGHPAKCKILFLYLPVLIISMIRR
jgi:glycosyltransferase involved in cell wall biosynthesis